MCATGAEHFRENLFVNVRKNRFENFAKMIMKWSKFRENKLFSNELRKFRERDSSKIWKPYCVYKIQP